ncbi:hypothetical protein GC254_17915, partial [Escherichia coli]|nr:hypothetical protein [Escherichia coli]
MTPWCHSSPGKRYAGPLNNKNRSFLLSLGYFTCINNQYIQQGAIMRIEVTIAKTVLTPKSWTVKHEAYRSDSDIQLESD